MAGIDNGIGSDGKGSIPPPSILDKLKYAAREVLPYLDNLRLLREGRIMPTLQQKPYQNPYDNMVTDINIQSNLNDIDRSTLTAMAQSTGNPSVRNARMAQLMSNITNAKNQLYSQKYNQENQLQNQKNTGTTKVLTLWEDKKDEDGKLINDSYTKIGQ